MTNFEGGNMQFVTRMFTCIALMFLCCALIVGIAGCGAKKAVTPGAPAATTLDKLSSSAYEIANALDSGEKEFEALYTSNIPGVSDDGYAKIVAQTFLSAQSCAGSYIAELKSLVAVDDSNKAQVVGWSSALVACVNNLVGSGVAGIKNPDARQKIQALLAPIPAAIKLIVDTMGIPAATAAPGNTQPLRDKYQQLHDSLVRAVGTCTDARLCESLREQVDGVDALITALNRSDIQFRTKQLNFTEVNDGPANRSRTHSPGNSVGGEPARISHTPQASKRSYQSTAPGRCSQAQQRGCDQDANLPFASQRRGITNPLREAWLYS
jgi:hypothetical protein